MILYTMMPHDLIFPVDETEFSRQQEIMYNGVPLMVQRTDDDHYQVVRVLSSDPSHYLDAQYVPGTKIPLH